MSGSRASGLPGLKAPPLRGNAWSQVSLSLSFFKGPVQSLSGLCLRERPWSAELSCSLSPAPWQPGRPRFLPCLHRGSPWGKAHCPRGGSVSSSALCGAWDFGDSVGPGVSWWVRMFTKSLGKPRWMAHGPTSGREDTGPFSHLYRISMRTKNYKRK